MKLIFKYLKPYVLIVLAVVALTFVQVQTELTLPDYMSQIVTNGIQYGGITEEVPLALTAEDLKHITGFMNEEDGNTVMSVYKHVSKGTKAKIDNQEVTFMEDVYVLPENASDLSEVILKPMVYAYLAEQTGMNLSEDNIALIPELEEKAKGLEDNFGSMAKLYNSALYERVGLSTQTIQSGYILSNGAIMLGIAAIGVIVQLISTYLTAKTSARIAAQMRRDIFEKVESFSSSEFSRFSTSSLITRSGNDITKVQQLIQLMLRMMLMSPIMGITAVFKVLRYPNISWLLIVAIGVFRSCEIFWSISCFIRFCFCSSKFISVSASARSPISSWRSISR